MVKNALTSLRFIVGTLVVCSVLYPALLLSAGYSCEKEQAQGSLVYDRGGRVVGSRLLAQKFTRAEYLWPRPSAADYDASKSGGSNLAPSNPALLARGKARVAVLTEFESKPVPGELVAASGSGLDPHTTLGGALYQAARIARARGTDRARVEEIIRQQAIRSTPWSPDLVNVLETNMDLDEHLGPPLPR